MACSVRPGRRRAILPHLCPKSATELTIVSSSCRDQLMRSGLLPPSPSALLLPRYLPPLRPLDLPLPSVRPASPLTLAGRRGFCASFSRFQRLRTASSERPGSMEAMIRQRQPWLSTFERMSSSSLADHSLRSATLRGMALSLNAASSAAGIPLGIAAAAEGAATKAAVVGSTGPSRTMLLGPDMLPEAEGAAEGGRGGMLSGGSVSGGIPSPKKISGSARRSKGVVAESSAPISWKSEETSSVKASSATSSSSSSVLARGLPWKEVTGVAQLCSSCATSASSIASVSTSSVGEDGGDRRSCFLPALHGEMQLDPSGARGVDPPKSTSASSSASTAGAMASSAAWLSAKTDLSSRMPMTRSARPRLRPMEPSLQVENGEVAAARSSGLIA
mmetsp:Transcript_18858/g.48188  ORF Transcript_18858/g.48188 Transcript_18858/m.48188 type:complete len:390 (+) Transcript_18858:317-1486(+)